MVGTGISFHSPLNMHTVCDHNRSCNGTVLPSNALWERKAIWKYSLRTRLLLVQ